MNTVTLYIMMAVCFLSVCIMLFTRVVFYAALALLVCLLSIAGIYALLHAEFLAITQIIIYAGGVIVLLLFGIMLTNRIAGKPLLTENQHLIPGVTVFIGFISLLTLSILQTGGAAININSGETESIRKTGIELMSNYVSPFEVSGILLLICLIGASLTAASFNNKKHE